MEETITFNRRKWKEYHIGDNHIDVHETTWTKKLTVKRKVIGNATFRYVDEEITKTEKVDNQEKYQYIKTIQNTYVIYRNGQQETKHQRIVTRRRTVLYENTVSINK